MDQVFEYAVKSGAGLFTVLFIALLAWVLRTNDQRENRYLDVIDKYGDKIDDKVTAVDGKVENLGRDMQEVKADVRTIITKGGMR